MGDALALIHERLTRSGCKSPPAAIHALLDWGGRTGTSPSTNRSDCDRNHHNRESREKDAGEQPSNHDNPLVEDAPVGSYSTFTW